MENNRLFKYFLIVFIFVIGLSLGNANSKSTTINESSNIEEVSNYYPVSSVEANFFNQVAHKGEEGLKTIFNFVFNIVENSLEFIFGL